MSRRLAALLCIGGIFALGTLAGGAAPVETPRKFDATDFARGREHWAFRAIGHPTPPSVTNAAWVTNDVDRFVLAALEAQGIEPAPEADRATLLRRASYGLIGLPPTPAELDAFLADAAPGAWERQVDRLLASPQYGERMARAWLDLARYADSNGLDENLALGNAWRYRDYVVRSFNANERYDRFLTQQIAGDLLPEPADRAELEDQLVATGFLVLGPKMLAEQDKQKLVMDVVDEQLDVTSRTFLGLTAGCARCHDHKFDPLPTRDYYALAGIFKSTATMANLDFVSRWNQRELAPQAELAARDRWVAEFEAAMQAVTAREVDARAALRTLFPIDCARIVDAVWCEQLLPRATADALVAARARRAELERTKPAPFARALAVRDAKELVDIAVHTRGSHLDLEPTTVPRGAFHVFDHLVPPLEIAPGHSGRLELARWMLHPEHPLTSRVFVNRLWAWQFGAGLVRQPSNFGLRSDPPSHPELLDWLARTFVESGYDVKAMQRVLLSSSTYRMSSVAGADLAARDPDNRLLARQFRKRLEAEQVRDGLLSLSGRLDPQIGGSLLGGNDGDYVTNDQSADAARYDVPRRSVYLPVIRNAMYDLFSAFDYADPGVHLECRVATVGAHQSLWMMNSPLVREAAQRVAERTAPTDSDVARIERVWRTVLLREPTGRDVERASRFLESARAATPPADAERPWQGLAQVLFESNEFMHVD